MFNVITIGDAVMDTYVFIDDASLECDYNHQNCQLCLTYAGKIPITNSWQSLGGNAANVAADAKKLGLKSAILTSVGDDANGKIIKAELKKQKVDTKFLTVEKEIKTRYSVILNFKGERTILSYHQKRGYHFPKKLPKTDWVYYTSLSDGYEDLQSQMLSWLNHQKNIRLAYNPGSIQLKNLDEAKKVATRADILIVNREEAEKLLNTGLNKESGRALLEKLLKLGTKEAVITNGADGAWAGNDREAWQISSFPVAVVSKTGAGDAFSAGYLAARFYHQNINTALKWGIAGSCAVISSPAGPKKNLPDIEEIKKIITQFSSIEPKPVN